MKIKYLAAVAAISVLGVTTLTSCGPSAEPDATEEVAPADGTMEEGTMEEDGAMDEGGAMEEPVDPATEPEG